MKIPLDELTEENMMSAGVFDVPRYIMALRNEIKSLREEIEKTKACEEGGGAGYWNVGEQKTIDPVKYKRIGLVRFLIKYPYINVASVNYSELFPDGLFHRALQSERDEGWEFVQLLKDDASHVFFIFREIQE